MAAPRNALPFQYSIRGQILQYAGDGEEEAMAIEERDCELEDFIGTLVKRIAALEAKVP